MNGPVENHVVPSSNLGLQLSSKRTLFTKQRVHLADRCGTLRPGCGGGLARFCWRSMEFVGRRNMNLESNLDDAQENMS